MTETFVEINVLSIDKCLEKVEEAGGTTVLPRGPISNLGFFAVVKDTEGNIVGLWEDVKK